MPIRAIVTPTTPKRPTGAIASVARPVDTAPRHSPASPLSTDSLESSLRKALVTATTPALGLQAGQVKGLIARFEKKFPLAPVSPKSAAPLAPKSAAPLAPEKPASLTPESAAPLAPEKSASRVVGLLKKLQGPPKWLLARITGYFEPYTRIPLLLSPDPVQRARGKDGLIQAGAKFFKSLRTTAVFSSSVIQWWVGATVTYFHMLPLAGLSVGFGFLFTVVGATQAKNARTRLKRLKKVKLKRSQLKPFLKFAKTQQKRRELLKGFSAAAALSTAIGSSICIGTVNAWNPVGWVFLGLGLSTTTGWLVYKLGKWVYNKVKGLHPKEAPLDVQIDALFKALHSPSRVVQIDAIKILRALGVDPKKLTSKSMMRDNDLSKDLVKLHLLGSEDFFI